MTGRAVFNSGHASSEKFAAQSVMSPGVIDVRKKASKLSKLHTKTRRKYFKELLQQMREL